MEATSSSGIELIPAPPSSSVTTGIASSPRTVVVVVY